MTDKQPEALIRADELETIGAESSLARAMAAHTIRLLYKENEALRARLAQREPEPVAWMAYENGEKHGVDFDEDEIAELPVGTMLYPIPPHFIDPAKVARLMDEAFERGKKEIDMEQVKDIAQKLADCALLNSAPPQPKQEPVAWMHDSHVGFNVPLYTAPPQREWQGLTDEEITETLKRFGLGERAALARAIEAKLKENNNG